MIAEDDDSITKGEEDVWWSITIIATIKNP